MVLAFVSIFPVFVAAACFATPSGRFGGIPLRRGEPETRAWFSLAPLGVFDAERLSDVEEASVSFSTAGGASKGVSISIGAMASSFW